MPVLERLRFGRRSARATCLTLILAIGVTAPGYSANETDQLKNLQTRIEQHTDRRDRLSRQVRAESDEIAVLTARLVDLARDLQAVEDEVSALETQVGDLTREEAEKAALLDRRREQLAGTLAALQRLSQQPLELAVTRPGSSMDVARGATLLTAVLPELDRQAGQIRADMDTLRDLRAALARDRQALEQELAVLESSRSDMDRVLQQREDRRQGLLAEADEEAQRIEALAAQARNLQDLIDRLDAERNQRAVAAADAATRDGKPGRKTAAARPPAGEGIASARGALPLPARGRLVRRFGAPAEAGRSKGIAIATRAGAQVVAPYDGQVVFAGPFRTYGQLLIISHGEGYHSLLAGLDRIYGSVGQWILAGEPVGTMGQTRPRNGLTAPPTEGPELYVELRRRGKPINPLPWLAAGLREVS